MVRDVMQVELQALKGDETELTLVLVAVQTKVLALSSWLESSADKVLRFL